MSSNAPPTEISIAKRTRRACEEAMVVHPHGGGSGIFDVWSGTNSDPYVISLHDPVGCTCPDFQNRTPAGGCKHIRRVRLEFGIEDIPTGLRSEHAAPCDVELARKYRGIDRDRDKEVDR